MSYGGTDRPSWADSDDEADNASHESHRLLRNQAEAASSYSNTGTPDWVSSQDGGGRGRRGGGGGDGPAGPGAGPVDDGRFDDGMENAPARRGLCLTLFGLVHATAIAGALTACGGEIVDMVASTTDSLVERVLFVVLRSYGALFCLAVAAVELMEFDGCRQLLCCDSDWSHNVRWSRFWWARGLIYTFVGLFAAETGTECDEHASSTVEGFVLYAGYVLAAIGAVVSRTYCR